MEESFSFLVSQLRPHPNPLPKGEGVYPQVVGTHRLTIKLPSIYDVLNE